VTPRPRLVAVALGLVLGLAAIPAGAQQAEVEGRTTTFDPRTTTIIHRVESVSGDVRTSESEDQVIVDLAADVLFAFDSADLAPAAQATLADLAATLEAEGQGTVTVVGHTDSKGDDAYNQTLSEQRAETVTAALEGLAPDFTYEASGQGETEPVAPNETEDGSDSEAGRALNRRVTITFAKAT